MHKRRPWSVEHFVVYHTRTAPARGVAWDQRCATCKPFGRPTNIMSCHVHTQFILCELCDHIACSWLFNTLLVYAQAKVARRLISCSSWSMEGYYWPPDPIYSGYCPPAYGGMQPWPRQTDGAEAQAPVHNMAVHPEGSPTSQTSSGASSEDETHGQVSQIM